MRTLLGWVIVGPSSYTACKARSVNCVFTWNVRLSKQLARMYETCFADLQSLYKRHSVEDAKGAAIVESCIQFLQGHFVVPLS